MATTTDICENTQRSPENLKPRLEVDMGFPSVVDVESGGYFVYLTQRQLLKAYPRARRENPGAFVHFERHDDDMWSLEVYKSEAAKDAYEASCYYREKALSTLTVLHGYDWVPDA